MRLNTYFLVLVLMGMLCVSARADMATPFLEGPASQVGAISEGRGYVLVAESYDGPVYQVMVSSDTEQNLIIFAKAEKGIVPAQLLGRPAVIKAEVVKAPAKPGRSEGAELKILSVVDGRKAKP